MTVNGTSGTHTVQRGDTMWGIAQSSGVSLNDLVKANPQIANPNLIHPGQQLNVPGQAGRDPAPAAPADGAPPRAPTQPGGATDPGDGFARNYRVRTGDTMSGIAQRMGVPLQDLVNANPQVRNPNLIYAGQELNVPNGGRAPSQPTAPVNPTRPVAPGANPYQAEFERAARTAGVPESWATNPSLIQLVKHESSFNPAAKNPNSTAFGLFQFLDSTWRNHLPEVPYGTRDPYWQAVGGFRYIQQRYQTPERAWAFWQATVNKDASIAPQDLQGLARHWISKGYAGY